VSDTNEFYSRYLDGDHDDRPETADADVINSGASFDEDLAPDTEAPQQAPFTPGHGRPDLDEPTFGVPPDVDAALRRGTEPAAPGQQAPTPDQYWPQGGGGRHGYDADPALDPAAHRPGARGPAASSPGRGYDSDRGDDTGVGRHAPNGSAPQLPPGQPVAPPNSRGPFRGEPQHHLPPASGTPDYPPQSGRDGTAAESGYPPARLQGGYAGGPGGDARQRPRPLAPDDERNVSVGDLHARIRESQVAPPYKPVPQMGWRKGLHRLTRINVGLSQGERDWNTLERRLRVDLRGNYVIAVMGSKGGVNKTTATICLGMALKQYRDEKIVAIDANPASGNLASRIKEPSTMSWRGLINDPNLRQYRDFRVYMGKDSRSGLEVLGSDPGDEPLTGNDLLTAWERLQVQYPIAVVDCGNQIRDDITGAILRLLPVDAIVVPSTTRLDGARGAAETLNWLLTHGYPHLVRQAVVMVSNINNVSANERVRALHEDFQHAVRAVHDVPFDQHLSDAVAIEFERLRPDTQRAYIEAAASLVDGFAGAADRESAGGGGSGHRGRL
jgi:MinD-like ATPase involved in chromosome partitioning or flagellar assembly